MDNNMEVVPMPRWSSLVGCARVLLAIAVLGLTAASTAIWGGYDEFIFTLFTVSGILLSSWSVEILMERKASASLLVFVYYFVALSRQPGLYNRWAVLGLEIFGVAFWLVSFLLLAHWTSVYNAYWFGENGSYGWWNAPYAPDEIGFRKRSILKRSTNKYHTGVVLAGTAAGLGGVELYVPALACSQCDRPMLICRNSVLYTLTLIVFGTSLHQQRVLAPQPDTVIAPDTTPASKAETVGADAGSEVKTEAEAVQV